MLVETAEVIGTCYPDVAARLLALHVPDHAGRCRSCRRSNRSAPLSPCGPRVLAEIAIGIAPKENAKLNSARTSGS